MEDYGFFRVAAAIPKVKVADCDYNVKQIKELIDDAVEKGIRIVCFPELSLTAYTCGDLFFQNSLTCCAEHAIEDLLKQTAKMPVTFIVGSPVVHNSKLYNCAVVCREGRIYGIVPKVYLPNYQEFYEKRWFEPYHPDTSVSEIVYAGQRAAFGTNLIFDFHSGRFAVELCEDVWAVIPPSSYHTMAGAQLIFNLSASNELTGKRQYVKSLLSQQSARCIAGYIYASAGFGESSTDVVYSGNGYVYENGRMLAESERFEMKQQLIASEIDIELLNSERRKNTTFTGHPVTENYRTVVVNDKNETAENLTRKINPTPFLPENYEENCEEIFSIQVAGLAKRAVHINAKTLVVGVSGGLDSTLALLVCVKTADKLGLSRKTVFGVTMPGYGTTGRTLGNAVALMRSLGTSIREIDIVPACEQHFHDINHDPEIHDITYENTQARERTQILMDIANKTGGMVIGTGDLSELALGWTTYSGDHISMYGVNAGIPKTLVRHLIKRVSEHQSFKSDSKVLADILETPVSPELLPTDSEGQMTQFTEDIVGPYELHDFFLFYLLRYGFSPAKIYFLARQAFSGKYDGSTIKRWLEVFYRRFFSQQFKRSCLPDGPKVGSVNLSPRGDWRMPSDASDATFISQINIL
ncbi:MAG: NAD(+) synthase [Dysgonamonadaceae bacterium]|jgi:NAD+ synthase (glutamine-hydrolysing)|nr:NAD(+) synthase [Dysgonamonadaceae bacterium]